ncbi:MAG: hypothetical protein QOF04_2792 [Solirubrobacteraceae bacterium]|nr:hypothetical protein [Solirubrobacteraceae bacterium]
MSGEVSLAPGSSGPSAALGSSVTGPSLSLMPHRPTIWRAICVRCWRSDSAPVVTVAYTSSSAVRPPSATRIWASRSSREYETRSLSGVDSVTPSATPRGMIDTLRTGSASGVSIPTSAWPDSWYAVRSRSLGLSRIPRGEPSSTFSSESVRSAMPTLSWPRRAASSAASLARFARSAPTIPGVEAARAPRSTSPPSGTVRVWTSRILRRPSRSGACTATRRSKRPGRSSAGSRTSGRLVAPSTTTASLDSKPSISVRIWSSVCSRSSFAPIMPAEPWRARPIASSSSMKTIAGAASLAFANRSRTRAAPTPTIASMNSDAAIEKNAACASPATARASSVLPVPGMPNSSTPCGIRPPSRPYFSGERRKSTISLSSAFASSIPATSSNVALIRCGSARRAPERPNALRRPRPPPAAARRPSRMNRPTSRSVGPKPSSSSTPRDVPELRASTWTPLDCRRLVSWASLQNDGTCVEKCVVGVACASPAG